LSKALLEEPALKEEQRKRRQYLALFAFATDQYESAASLGAEPLGELYPGVKKKMRDFNTDQRSLESAVAIMSSAGREEFRQAEKKFRIFDLDGAEPLYQKAAAKMKEETKPASFIARLATPPSYLVARRLDAIRLERELAAASGDGWVKVRPDINTWQVMGGEWLVQDDGALAIKGADTPGLILAPVRPGENFELRGEFEVE
jgi:hypothetical protein